MLEDTLERRTAPALALLAEHGRYRRAISTFPSLTPVCLSSLATGAHPDVHEIPHLVWYHRGEQRLVEYGSSFGAVRAAGTRQSLLDTVYGLNASHLGQNAVTVYEALEDAGLTAAAVNITCYRGRTEHRPTVTVPVLTRPTMGPSRFFFYNLFESDVTGAPLSVRNRSRGTIDAYAAAVGRWLVTRDGFDFLVFYLSDYDYASHVQGPDAAHAALARCDDAVGGLIEAAGGPDEFLERYAVILCSDHGQTQVDEVERLEDDVSGGDRDRVEPGGDGLLGRRPRPSSRRGSTATRASTSCSTARATKRSRAGTARSCGSRRTGRAATPRSSTIRRGWSAPGRRSRIRTPAS